MRAAILDYHDNGDKNACLHYNPKEDIPCLVVFTKQIDDHSAVSNDVSDQIMLTKIVLLEKIK